MLRIDKNIYNWAVSLCKYGDVYVQLFKKSEVDKFQSLFTSKETAGKEKLNEDVKLNLYKKGDKYVNYVEMFANPAEIFELTKFGKTAGYIKTEVPTVTEKQGLINNFYNYKFKSGDINIFPANKFVHATLGITDNRVPETVTIFKTDADYDTTTNGYSYNVRRGKSLFYDSYKTWRELMLLENSVLMNRLTRSSILRIFNIEIPDMPKEQVGKYLLKIKQMVEQKAALTVGDAMNEYTSAGPYENFMYVPVHEGKGAITQEEIGGDVNIGQLPDIDYFTSLLFGGLKIPKQYFGLTDDGAGFNGGQSLSIISSRYAKTVKRIQTSLIQLVTDIINLLLIDKGLNTYVNKFRIKMQAPTTQEELDRKEYTSSKVQIANDVMNLTGNDVTDPATKLKMIKSLLSKAVTNPELISYLQDEIDKLEAEEESEEETGDNEPLGLDMEEETESGEELFGNERPPRIEEPQEEEQQEENVGELNVEPEEEEELPTPEELGIDLTSPEQF